MQAAGVGGGEGREGELCKVQMCVGCWGVGRGGGTVQGGGGWGERGGEGGLCKVQVCGGMVGRVGGAVRWEWAVSGGVEGSQWGSGGQSVGKRRAVSEWVRGGEQEGAVLALCPCRWPRHSIMLQKDEDEG